MSPRTSTRSAGCELYPDDRSYLSVYQRFGLLRERAVYAHCLHLDDTDRALLRESGTGGGLSDQQLLPGQRLLRLRAPIRPVSAMVWRAMSAAAPASPWRTMLSA